MKYWLTSVASCLDYPRSKRELENLAQLGFTLTPHNAQYLEVTADSPEVSYIVIRPPAEPVEILSLVELVEQLDRSLILERRRSPVNGALVEGEYEVRVYNDYVE